VACEIEDASAHLVRGIRFFIYDKWASKATIILVYSIAFVYKAFTLTI